MLAIDSWLNSERSRSASLAILLGMLALAYFVLLGEAGQRDPAPVIRLLSAVVAGTLILIYLVNAPRLADRVDTGILIALLLFAGAALVSQFPRQSFDALLGALLFAAAFFVARSLLAVDEGRQAFAICLMALSAFFTFLVAAVWLPSFFQWWALTDWTVFPPLDLDFLSAPWGHRHDLTLLVVMLYPSWWLGHVSPFRAAMGTVVGILALLIVLVDGSRTIWIATSVASAALLIPVGLKHWPRNRKGQVALGLLLTAGLPAFVISGALGSVLERVLTFATVSGRLAMWGPLVEAWLSRPIAGYGPGAFTWVLQQTNYFDMNSFAPRHPDSAVFQLLPEAGLLGVMGMVVILVTLIPPILRGTSLAPRWALITFAVAGLGANPTNFGFLVAVAISWAAFAVPHLPAGETPPRLPRPWLRRTTVIVLCAVAVACAATGIAEMAYLSARTAIGEGRVREAVPHLVLATHLDPGMAVYARQLGIAQLLTDDAPAAVLSLERATELNPYDDITWRALALAHGASGDVDSSGAALARALDVQRSDPTNLLLLARWELEHGSEATALETLEEVVLAWPEIVASPGWTAILPPSISTRDVVDGALNRWSQDLPSPLPISYQPALLGVWAGRSGAAGEWAAEALGRSLGATYVAAMGCAGNAGELLETAPEPDRRTPLYWSLVIQQSILDGQVNNRAVRLLTLMTGDSPLSSAAVESMNPLHENDELGYSADLWGYQRLPIDWPDYAELPSPVSGASLLSLEPRGATDGVGLDSVC